jgi:mannose-6-phosphate isomerase
MSIDPRNVYKLKGTIQHYAWGGYDFIPRLLGIDNSGKQPFAEYWMGAHSSAPSHLLNGNASIPLNELFQSNPQLLGSHTRQKFRQLPYLFKLLDVREMLSIQVHPSKEEAEKGFDAEEERGLELTSPKRNYKDRNHKPEVMIALSDFWLLHGFKPEAELKATLSVPQLRSLIPVFDADGYEGLYRYVMELPQQEVNAMLSSLVQKEVRRRSFHESERNEPGYWVGEYYLNSKTENIDRGIFSIYFFNLVYLQPGQGIFQGAGVPHAYLCGQNVELMANSDNVLRAGLTNKHVDIDELLKHTRFEAVHPDILTGEHGEHENIFHLPVEDFMIGQIILNASDCYTLRPTGPEILICVKGEATVNAGNTLNINKGEVFIAFPGSEVKISASSGAVFFRAAVPL